MAFNCQRYPKIFSLFLTFSHFLSFFIIFYHFLSFFTTFVFIIYVTKILSKLIPTNLGTNIVSLTIKIIHIDNMAKHTEKKHVGKLCCFESHICKLDRQHITNQFDTLRISHKSHRSFFCVFFEPFVRHIFHTKNQHETFE